MMTIVKKSISSCQHGAIMRQAAWRSGRLADGNVEVSF